jgi:hypothetical protein
VVIGLWISALVVVSFEGAGVHPREICVRSTSVGSAELRVDVFA